mgnify:CR=1 FL=1
MTIRVQLIGCLRYSYKGELFEKAYQYDLDDAKARALLQSKDDRGRPYFSRVEEAAEDDEEVVVTKEEVEEIGGVRISRTRGRPRKASIVRASGDSAPLRDDAREDAHGRAAEDAGVEV